MHHLWFKSSKTRFLKQSKRRHGLVAIMVGFSHGSHLSPHNQRRQRKRSHITISPGASTGNTTQDKTVVEFVENNCIADEFSLSEKQKEAIQGFIKGKMANCRNGDLSETQVSAATTVDYVFMFTLSLSVLVCVGLNVRAVFLRIVCWKPGTWRIS